ncbi:MAG: phosphatidate cytidylyltransferase [Flavobacteriales bacterium AspAUS03]
MKTDWFIRFLSGFIYIGLVLYAIFASSMLFHMLMMIFSILCLWEFFVFSKMRVVLIRKIMVFVALSMLVEILNRIRGSDPTVCLILFPMMCFISELFSKSIPIEKIHRLSQVFFGWMYVGVPFFLARHFYTCYDQGKNLIMGLFILIWVNDTLAYLVGRRWGKKKIFPSVSPEKTIEGFLGGFFFCLLCSLIFYKIWGEWYWFVMGLVVTIFGTLGDLLESVLKRAYGVKDSGKFFPGHGGFLDRLDSFVFVIPIVVSYFFLFV